MSYFHPEEDFHVWVFYGQESSHPGTRYLIEFADSECYVCHVGTAYDSENGGELDIQVDDPLYDEFARRRWRSSNPLMAGCAATTTP